LGNTVDFGGRVEVGRIAFEDDGVCEFGIAGDDEKYFAGDFEDEARGYQPAGFRPRGG
jgi:hypothetical protein